jgi:hypothetical protein
MSGTPTCPGCEMEYDWPGVEAHGETYCCEACAHGKPCVCPQHYHGPFDAEEAEPALVGEERPE